MHGAILLTASVDTKGCAFVKRNDPIVREADYIKAIKLWEKVKHPIVFCENSGYNLAKIKGGIDKVEFLQFDGQNYPRNLGKGYGELKIINYAIDNSEILKQADFVVKATGRLYISNIEAIIKENVGIADVVASVGCHIKSLDTRIFIFKKFFIYYLNKFKDRINDSTDFYIEHALYEASLLMQEDGYKLVDFVNRPIVCGISATGNISYKKRPILL